jgi:hypothetical protein
MDYLQLPQTAREGLRLWQVAQNTDPGASSPTSADRFSNPCADRVTLHANAVADLAAQIRQATRESVLSKVKQALLPSWFSSPHSAGTQCQVHVWPHRHLQKNLRANPSFEPGSTDAGHQADLDLVVASPFGVLVIEVKTWKGTVHASGADAGQASGGLDASSPWVQVEQARDPWVLLQPDGTSLPRKNPIAQVMAKARALRESLVEANAIPRSCVVQGLVVFSDSACTLAAEVAVMDHVLRPSAVPQFIKVLALEGLGPIVAEPQVLRGKFACARNLSYGWPYLNTIGKVQSSECLMFNPRMRLVAIVYGYAHYFSSP